MSYDEDPFESDTFEDLRVTGGHRSLDRPSSSSRPSKYHVGVGSIVTPLQVSMSMNSIPTKASQPLIRIKIMSATRDNDYHETVETPAHSSLRSLRVFILKTFPYFPTKFLFRVHKNEHRGKGNLVVVSQEEEKKFSVGMLARQEVFVQRYISTNFDEAEAPRVVPIQRASTAVPKDRLTQSQQLPSPLKTSLDASHEKMMSLFRARFEAEKSSNLQSSMFGDSLIDESQKYRRPHTASAAMTTESNKVRPKTVDNSKLTRVRSGVDRGRSDPVESYRGDSGVLYGEMNSAVRKEHQGRHSVWNEYIPFPERVSSSLSASLHIAGLQHKDLQWNRFRQCNGNKKCVVNFDDDGEYRRFILEQIVLMQVENLVLRIQMMVRRKLAIIRVQTLRVYLKGNPHIPNPPKAEYEIGAQIEARYNGRGDWYPGCVVGYVIKRIKKKPKMHYNILYDDGDRDEALSKEFIRHFEKDVAIERQKIQKEKRRQPGSLSDEEEERRRAQEEALLKKIVEDTSTEKEAKKAKADMENTLKLMQEEAANEEAVMKAYEIAKAAELKARTERNLVIARREEERRVAQGKIEAERQREEHERCGMLQEELHQRKVEELRQIATAKAIAEAKARAEKEERARREMEANRIKRKEEERQVAITAAKVAQHAQLKAKQLAEQKRLMAVEDEKRKEKERIQQTLVSAAIGFGKEQDEINAQLEKFEHVRLDRLHREQATIAAQVIKQMTRHIVESIVNAARHKEQKRLQKMQLRKSLMLNERYEVVTDGVIKKADKVISRVEEVEAIKRSEQEAVVKERKEKEDAERAQRRAEALARSKESRDKLQTIADHENAIKKKNAETLLAVVTDWISDVMSAGLTSRVEMETSQLIQADADKKAQEMALWEQRLRRVKANTTSELSKKFTDSFLLTALTNRIRSCVIEVLGDISVKKLLEEAVRVHVKRGLIERERSAWQGTMAPFFSRMHTEIENSGTLKEAVVNILLPNPLSSYPTVTSMPLEKVVTALVEGVPMSISKAESASIYRAYCIDPVENVDMMVDVRLFLTQAELLQEEPSAGEHDNDDVVGSQSQEALDQEETTDPQDRSASHSLNVTESLEGEVVLEVTPDEGVSNVNSVKDEGMEDLDIIEEGILHDLASSISSRSLALGVEKIVDAEVERLEKEKDADIRRRLKEEKSRAEELQQMAMEIALNVSHQISNSLVREVTVNGVEQTVENVLPKRILAAAFRDDVVQMAVKKIALKLSVQRRGSSASAKLTRAKSVR